MKHNLYLLTFVQSKDMVLDEFSCVEGVIFLKDLFEEIADIDF